MPPATTTDSTTRPHILLVEDSRTSMAVLSKDLSDHYTLINARDGEEAWQILQLDPRVELVITDINMPRLTGQQLLVMIRRSTDPRIRSLPVIVMTTAHDNAEKNLAFLNGANDFVNKPVDALELQARVRVHQQLARTIRELEASKKALAEQATTDPLTHLKNRRSFYEQAEQHLAAAKRYKTDVSLLLLDIDHFKKVNDNHGHQAGDEVLVRMAELLSGMLRGGDTVARIGGEEFAILLPETNRLGAAVLAERIRGAVERQPFDACGTQLPVTASIGLASLGGEDTESVDQLLSIADRRLYLAKNNGRNRICINDEGRASFA